MKKCPYCGFENEEQTEVCKRCKAGLPHDEGSHQAADARGGQAGQEHGDGKAFGQDGIKDC